MKRFKYIILLALAGTLLTNIRAQSDADLLRFSMLNPIGTARFNAMGGAMGALGANFSTLSTNPAGIGFFTRHEISFTAGMLENSANSKYYGTSSPGNTVAFTWPEVGGIFEFSKAKSENGLKHLQIGFGLNQLQDFNSSWRTRGINPQSSYMWYIENESRGYDFYTEPGLAHPGTLAYQTGLMDFADTVNYNSYLSFLPAGLNQSHIIKQSGNISEMVFSFGGNWSDKLYFGLTLGVPFIDYQQISSITEETPDNLPMADGKAEDGSIIPGHNFRSYTFDEDLRITGTGINLKLGLIYAPAQFVRIGLAFHTPTYYWLNERADVDLNTNMRYLFNGSPLPNAKSYRYNDLRYGISTPAKGILSVGFLIKNFGAIGIEGELINYRGMRLFSDDLNYQTHMSDIVADNYRLSGVVRFGTEWKVSIVSLRAGYVWQSCPYTDATLRNNWYDHTACAGIGLTLGRWNVDFAFMANLGGRSDRFYYYEDANGASLMTPAKVNFSKYTYTLGASCKF